MCPKARYFVTEAGNFIRDAPKGTLFFINEAGGFISEVPNGALCFNGGCVLYS